ncbi:hypothetical protein ASE30_05465 [Achromobacter sp. Root83]|uniref:RHS repeat-associated core domain-containing protein n=1 Tax=Achromobacter sp. Root83 TaxID=1736602 RepID=UPI0007099261|nr:RHS repeat-associated core domain-containing protein [Achromobacter sp. Root83]KRC76067.1 hypothetical protein ASE30_05465 [Achromobacter sp. Root83]
MREYVGTHYQYDARGNLIDKLHNGKRSRFEWDLFNRLTGYSNDTLRVSYQYDALGRRLMKQSEAHWQERPGMTHAQRQEEKARLNRALGCGATLYGWDGDTLAWEGRDDQTTHYLYEPGSFVPLAQAISRKSVLLHQQPVYAGGYDIDQDPLWTTSPEPDAVDALAWYQCDHLGTPQELTDADGEIVWSAQYKAWGVAKEAISSAARSAGIRNPIRHQGQYLDYETGLHYNRHRYYDPEIGRFIAKDPIGFAGGYETGLHYNRHRYYDPEIGRFIAKDPIGFAGGLNVYQYADNPVEWIDPLGLAGKKGNSSGTPKQSQAKVAKGQAPSDITRIDGPEASVPNSQWHAHCKCGSGLNLDGSIHDKGRGDVTFSRKTIEWLRDHGWESLK